MRAGRARALVFALVIMVAALIASLLALAAATKPAEAAFPGTNGKIAFDRSFRIWVKNPSLGAEETKLRDDVLSDSYAAYSPDGSRVAFRRSPPPEIYVTNADGTGKPRRLTNNTVVDGNPVWSPDGTRIAFERATQIWSMNADGTKQKALTATELPTDDPKFDPTQPSYNPAWSVSLSGAPDGKIAFVHQGRLWTMNPDGSSKDELNYSCPTPNGHCDTAVGAPTFSPDGTKIAFDYSGDIYWTNTAGGGNSTPILRDSTGTGEYPGDEKMAAWSPNGAEIAFEHDIGGDSSYDIYAANADGSSTEATQLTNNSFDEFNPDWQPIPQCTESVNANNDTLVGTADDDVLCGDTRNNTINGGGGNDVILSEAGNDRLIGGLGNDTLNGGTGIDTALYSSSSASIRASLTTGFSTGQGSDVLLEIENLTGSDNNDILKGAGTENSLVGGDGADKMYGLGRDDRLNGRDGAGTDTLDGGTGTDTCLKDAGDSGTACE